MNRVKTYLRLVLIALMITTPLTIAYAGTGSLRIEPFWPTMVVSPADFDIWAQTGMSYDTHALVVITEACYIGLTGDATIEWTGASSPATIDELDWVGPLDTGDPDIPPGAEPGANYTIASLKDHLGTSGKVYYSLKPILDAPLGSTKVPITVTIHSSDIKALVYIIGYSQEGLEDFDVRVPPTPAGFVVPEVPYGTLIGLVSMLTALYIAAKKPTFITRQ